MKISVRSFEFDKNHSLEILLKKVKLNFRIMSIAYLLMDVVLSSIFIIHFSEELKQGQIELLIFPAVLSVFLLSILLILNFRWHYNKKDKYSIFTVCNTNTISDFDKILSRSDQITDGIYMNKDYIFVLGSSFYIPYIIPINDITYMWQKSDKPYSLIRTKDNSRKYKIPFGAKLNYHAVKKLFFDKLKEYSPNLQPLDRWRND